MTDPYDSLPLDDDYQEPNPLDSEPIASLDEEAVIADDSSVYRGGSADPAFGFLLAIAVSVGLTPILPTHADMRYTLAWGALAGVGVLSWLFGNSDRIGQEHPGDVGWGVGLGGIVSIPFAIFFFTTFGRAAHLIFPDFGYGTALAYLVFIMPLAETLFFRGLLQKWLDMWFTGLLGGVWSVILFFPVMWGEVLDKPAVAIFLAIALFIMNLTYSYVRERNGLAAAWICQIVANVILIFAPMIQTG